MPIVLGRVSDARLQRIAEGSRQHAYSYADPGMTAGASTGGYHIDRWSADLGDGADVFDRAVDGLHHWQAHRTGGARVAPNDAELTVGSTVVVAIGLVGITVVAPCRIVYVTDEPDRVGFAYGTLTGHPERGEESFHVERTNAGVRFEVVACATPAHPLARVAGPVSRLLQARTARRYLAGLEEFVRAG